MKIFQKLKDIFKEEPIEEQVNNFLKCISPFDENPILELGSTFKIKFCKLVLFRMKEKGFELIAAGSYGCSEWTSQVLYFKRAGVKNE